MKKTLVILLAFFSLCACSNNPNASGLLSATTPTSPSVQTTADQCTTPTTTIIDYGQRRTSGAALNVRGAFSDIAINPLNSLPAMIFNETNTTAGVTTLKYQFWNGNENKIETIAGGITTTFIRLVFLSSGKPLVFFGNGATGLFMATRSTSSLTSIGVWTATVIDTSSTAIRAIDASVNPLDQVVVSFAVNTTSSNVKASLCTANCDVATNYTAMTNSLDAAAGTAMNQMGVGWCKSSSTAYYPLVLYSGSANAILTSCRNASLSSCTDGSNWTTDVTLTGSGANLVATQLYVDSSTANSTVYMAVKHSGGIRPYTFASCASSVTTTSSDPGTNYVVATTTVGNAWLNLSYAQGRFHIVANDAQTMIKYFNQTTAAFATTNWKTTVTPVETTGAAGIAAAGSARGGMIADENSDQILAVYGRTLAVTPTQTFGNVVMAYNDCLSGAGSPACSSTTLGSDASSTGMSFGNAPIDSTGQVQRNILQVPNVAVAATSAGRPASAYIDFSIGISAEPVTGAMLKYAYRDGSLATDKWIVTTIPTNSAPQSPSIAFDHLDRPWVSWFETATATGGFRYYLAMNYKTDGTSFWNVYSYPISDAAANTLPVMNQTSLAMYYSAGVAKPVMVILRNPATNKGVHAAMFNPVTSQWEYQQQIISLAGTTTPGGAWLTSSFNTSGNIVVAVHDMGTGAGATCSPTTTRCVRMTSSTNGGQTWATAGQIYSGAAEGLEISLNPSSAKPAIAFFNRASNLVKYKYCSSAIASCTTSTNWLDLDTGIIDGIAGVSGLTDNGATANAGLLNVGLTFTSEGTPWVTWPRGASAPAKAHLMFSTVGTAGTFNVPSVLSYNAAGYASSPVASNAGNMALSWNPRSVRTSTGSLHTVYIGPGNFLYATSCGN